MAGVSPYSSRILMKKNFALSHPKIAYPRLIEAAKGDVKKYLKRERNKKLPDWADYWGFDCKFGQTEETAEVIRTAKINENISFAESQAWTSFYLEILAVPAERVVNVQEDDEQDDSESFTEEE